MRPRSSVVVPIGPSGRVLVLRRGPTDPWMPGRWNYPGGKVDPGEDPYEAALRELSEEAGFHIPRSRLVWMGTMRGGPRRIHLFWVRLPVRPAVTMPDGEHDAFAWVPPGRFPGLPIPSAREVGLRAAAASRRAR